MEGFKPEQKEGAESRREQFPTKETILGLLPAPVEGRPFRIDREVSDEHGLVQLEVYRDAETKGEMVEYEYIRKGTHTIVGKDGTSKTVRSANSDIDVTYYQDGVPIHGTTYALYDEQTGTYKVFELPT